MAEQKNSMPPRRPGGPGHGPRSHGYQRPQDLRGTVKKLLHYVGRYKGLLVLVAVCLLLSSVGSVASSYFLKPAINDYILPGDFAGLLKLLVLMGLVFVLSALCSYVYSRPPVRRPHEPFHQRHRYGVRDDQQQLRQCAVQLPDVPMHHRDAAVPELGADPYHLRLSGADAAGGEGHRWTQPGQLPAAAGRSWRPQRLH